MGYYLPMTKEEYPFTGKIIAVSPDGGYGVVRMTETISPSFDLAVIGPETVGRMALMSKSKQGVLVAGTDVSGKGIKISSALRALEIQLLP